LQTQFLIVMYSNKNKMAAVPMLAGVGLMMVCCSSSSAMMMMGGTKKKEDDSDSDSDSDSDDEEATVEPIMFGESTLPDAADATIVEPGFEWSHGTLIEPPNKSYNMVLQGDNNMCINEPGAARACLMSNGVGGTAKAFFQGDGNICVRNIANMNDAKCYMSHNNDVPDGQHRLVLHNNGDVYVDHGTGVAGRFVLYTPPTTETYVLPY
jgi:hypothetical protein